MSGESAIAVIIQEAPTICTNPPKFEARLAIQTARKIGWRSGTKGELRSAAGSTPSAASSALATSATGWA